MQARAARRMLKAAPAALAVTTAAAAEAKDILPLTAALCTLGLACLRMPHAHNLGMGPAALAIEADAMRVVIDPGTMLGLSRPVALFADHPAVVERTLRQPWTTCHELAPAMVAAAAAAATLAVDIFTHIRTENTLVTASAAPPLAYDFVERLSWVLAALTIVL